MWNDINKAAGVRGNWAVNLLAPVPRTRLQVLCEMLGRHVMNIFHPYILRDVWRPEISPKPPRHSSQTERFP